MNSMLCICFSFAVIAIYISTGAADDQTSNFIVGGVDAKDDEIPYQVSLQYNERHYCSGALLNYRWVVTTAACASSAVNISALSVLAGTTNLNTGGVRIAVNKTVVHEEYKRPLTNNIALIKLKCISGLKLNKNIQPAILHPTFIGGATNGTVSGWGYVNTTTPNPTNNLKELNVTTITNEDCQDSYQFKILDGNLCTFDGEGKGFCRGDGGGPLVMVSTNHLIGLVSNNVPCARGRPDIYTRISPFVPWLTENMNK